MKMKMIIKTLIIITLTAVSTLCLTAFLNPSKKNTDIIDLNDITAFSVDNNVLTLTINGNDYILEPENNSQVQVWDIQNGQDWADFSRALINRNGKTFIEINYGTVIADDGEGRDINNWYVKYDENQFDKGNKVRSVYLYNEYTNEPDDVIFRQDSLYF